MVYFSSISRNAGITTAKLEEFVASNKLELDHAKEWKLVKCLLKYSEVLLKAFDDLLLHSIFEHIYELASVFNEFYENCNCIQKDKNTGAVTSVNMSRIVMCELTASVLQKCLNLLDLQTIERM